MTAARERDSARRIACALLDETVAAEAVVEAARVSAGESDGRWYCRACNLLVGLCDCSAGALRDALAAYDALHSDEVTRP